MGLLTFQGEDIGKNATLAEELADPYNGSKKIFSVESVLEYKIFTKRSP